MNTPGTVGPANPGKGSPPPEPDSRTDRLWRRVLWLLPTGLYVIGSSAGGRRNMMTANLLVQLSTEPRVVGVSVERAALTHELVSASGAFSVSILDREDRAIVRKFVKPVSEWTGGTEEPGAELKGFPVNAKVTGAPILDRAVAYLDCRVVGTMEFASHIFFAGEVVEAGFQGSGSEESAVLRMEDTRMKYGG